MWELGFYPCYLTPQHCPWATHRVTSLSAPWAHCIVGGRKNRGYNPRWVRQRVVREEEERQEMRGDCYCLGQWTPRQAVWKFHPAITVSVCFLLCQQSATQHPLSNWEENIRVVGLQDWISLWLTVALCLCSLWSFQKRKVCCWWSYSYIKTSKFPKKYQPSFQTSTHDEKKGKCLTIHFSTWQ